MPTILAVTWSAWNVIGPQSIVCHLSKAWRNSAEATIRGGNQSTFAFSNAYRYLDHEEPTLIYLEVSEIPRNNMRDKHQNFFTTNLNFLLKVVKLKHLTDNLSQHQWWRKKWASRSPRENRVHNGDQSGTRELDVEEGKIKQTEKFKYLGIW